MTLPLLVLTSALAASSPGGGNDCEHRLDPARVMRLGEARARDAEVEVFRRTVDGQTQLVALVGEDPTITAGFDRLAALTSPPAGRLGRFLRWRHAAKIELMGLAGVAAAVPWLQLTHHSWAAAGLTLIAGYRALTHVVARVPARVLGGRLEMLWPRATVARWRRREAWVDTVDRLARADAPTLATVSPHEFAAGVRALRTRGFTPAPDLTATVARAATMTDPDFARGLRLNEDLLGTAAADAKLTKHLAALDEIIRVVDGPLLEKLAAELLNQRPLGRLERLIVKGNSYLMDYPERRTEAIDLNYRAITLVAGRDLTPYARGVLATMLPASPSDFSTLTIREFMAADRRDLDQDGRSSRVRRALTRPEHRRALIDLIEQVLTRPDLLRGLNPDEVYGPNPPDIVVFGAADLEHVRRELRDKKPLSRHDQHAVGALFVALQHDLSSRHVLLRFSPPKRSVRAWRDLTLRYAAKYFRDVLPVKTPFAVLSILLSTIIFDAPVPVAATELRTTIQDAAQRDVLPLKAERARVVRADTTELRAVDRLELRDVDHFAPGSGPSFGRARAALADDPAPTTPVEADVPEELRLNMYTGRDAKFGLDTLKTDRVYQFRFAEESGGEVIQRARFAPEVLAWMGEHPRVARKLVDTLCLGHGGEGRLGIRPLQHKSSAYDGRVFEIKIPGAYRPILIHHRGEWQVLFVAHKDGFDRQVERARPLE